MKAQLKELGENPQEQTCTIRNLDDNITHYFVVRAFDTAGFESADSNEVCYAPQKRELPPDIVEIGEVIVDQNWKWVEFNDSQ